MIEKRLDYDRLSDTYDQRYDGQDSRGVLDALKSLATQVNARRVLEVGCGSGHWLVGLMPVVEEAYGVDPSKGMLRRAQAKSSRLRLTQGSDDGLSFAASFFDLVFCVNAIHHFNAPERFVHTAYELLRPGGALAVVGMDPHASSNRWYAYEFFTGVRDLDLQRFPAWDVVKQWMRAAGFEPPAFQEVERVQDLRRNRDVLDDPYLRKGASSQLALLSQEAYDAGLAKINAVIAEAEKNETTMEFPTVLSIGMLSASKGAHPSSL